MTLPSLKRYVYEALNPDDNSSPEAKLNILHAVYLSLIIQPDIKFIKGQQVFERLVNQYSKEIEEV